MANRTEPFYPLKSVSPITLKEIQSNGIVCHATLSSRSWQGALKVMSSMCGKNVNSDGVPASCSLVCVPVVVIFSRPER